ncbi:MAG: hypothetical protein ACRC8S_16450 [Fimbriiglobus sp.]
MDTPPKTYKPSGRTNLSDLWPYLIVLTAVASLAATVYAILLDQGWYAMILVPLFPVAIQRLIVKQAVFDCHARSPLKGFALFSSILSFVYFGSFHVDQCRRWNVDWYRVNLLPGYITFRMETDVLERPDQRAFLVKPISSANEDKKIPYSTPRIQFTLNWCLHVLDYCVIALIPGCVGWYTARQPYSESARQWHSEEQILLTDPSTNKLRASLVSDTVDEWVKSDFQAGNPEFVHCIFKIWYCPRATIPSHVEPDFYVSIDSQRPVLISQKSVIALSQIFPGLYEWGEVSHESLKPTPESKDVAVCETVNGPHIGKCSTYSNSIIIGLMSLAIWLAWLFANFAFLATSVYLLDLVFPGNRMNLWVVFPVGFLAILYLKYMFQDGHGLGMEKKVETIFFRKVLQNQIQNRQDFLFDTHSENVVYGIHYPRSMWFANTWAHKNLAERFLFSLDQKKRILLLEGDSTRWIIPLGSIQYLGVEYANFLANTEEVGAEFAVVVLKFSTQSGLFELPITCEHGVPGKDSFERAESFRQLLDVALNPCQVESLQPEQFLE